MRTDPEAVGRRQSALATGIAGASAAQRYLGIDAGVETLKVVELLRDEGGLHIGRRGILEHGKKPGTVLWVALRRWNWEQVNGAAVTGRFASQFNLSPIPTKQAQLRGYQFFFGHEPATIVNIGSHGFSVLEVRASGQMVFRENSRCSQGTGNFLRQLVERFSLTVEEASVFCADVANPAPLSGRCPVILKTDMTHLANKGEDRARILAGLFDAVCENVLALIKPGQSPSRVLLVGGVSRSPRVRRVFGESLARLGMNLVTLDELDSLCLEAIGSALVAAESPDTLPELEELLLPPRALKLERLPALGEALAKVRRMPAQPWAEVNGEFRRLVLGFDIGSTGSKLVAMDLATRETVWEGYRQTLGDPVGAAQELLRRFSDCSAAKYPIVAFGATGSGREVAGSLLTSCYGKDAVYIVNEIVAHATGALHYDPRVDTIFEIGGQDAKYMRLAEGRIIDCAMNEACSAGTGSFIEEQGRKFAGIQDVRQLGQAALAASSGVSLGQHCSVFMAEVIDEAVAAGVDQPAIISGLYDSIIKNYLNRVKGNRSVGKVIFCQGMPFSADALAAAVARQTGSEVIVPPNPGTVGALGIALLAARELDAHRLPPIEAARFLGAKVEHKDTFVCGSNCGCGGAGNRCRIERLRTLVNEQRSAFTWGGGCSLYDKGTRKRKLPDLAPDPFREREDLLQKLVAPLVGRRSGPRIALCDEFMLKGLFPFFAAFLHEVGFDLELVGDANPATLKRGIQSANAPFCAPMQLFHGLAERMAETGADWLFVPMIRSVPRVSGQRCSVVCPVVQAAPDVTRWSLAGGNGHTEEAALKRGANGASVQSGAPRILSPIIDFTEGNLESKAFLRSCKQLAAELGLKDDQCHRAWNAGVAAQREFDGGCRQIGQRALEYCREHAIVPVVVLGRSYTIYNNALYIRWHSELMSKLEAAGRGDLSLGSALWQVTGGRLFGLSDLLAHAGTDFATLRGRGELPLVELVGEIYVRSVGFSNDFIIEKLEERGLRVHLASKTEWVMYCGQVGRERRGNHLPERFAALVEHRIEALATAAIARRLGWAMPPSIDDILDVAQPYVNEALHGEAVLTVGTPLLAWRRGQIDAVVSVGPLECMPTKIAEAQFHHVTERERLLNLTLSFNGDPINTAALDNFAYEVKTRAAQHRAGRPQPRVEI